MAYNCIYNNMFFKVQTLNYKLFYAVKAIFLCKKMLEETKYDRIKKA